MKLEKRFPERRVVITGAGSGLGRALALEFASRGWRVAVTDINMARLAESAAQVAAAGGSAREIACDVTKPADFARVLEAVRTGWGGIDVLVNNAGVAAGGFMDRIPMDEWERIIDINLKSVIIGCRTFIPQFAAQGSGHIVNVASNAGIASLAEMSSYNVTKAGVISLSETLRVELAPRGVGVTVVCPTFFKTNLMDGFRSSDERQRRLAEGMFAKASIGAGEIARHVVRSIERGRLYALAQKDARLAWRGKRLAPEAYFRFLGWAYRTGMFEKYAGVR